MNPEVQYGYVQPQKNVNPRRKLMLIAILVLGLLLLLVVVLGAVTSRGKGDNSSSKGAALAFIKAIDTNNADSSYDMLTDKAKSYEQVTAWEVKIDLISKLFGGSVKHAESGDVLANGTITNETFTVKGSENKDELYRVDVTLYRVAGSWLVNGFTYEVANK